MAFSYVDPYSRTAYNDQVGNFSKYAKKFDTGYNVVSPYAEAAMKYFAPGGGYGVGQKMSVTKKIQQGVAADQIAAVNSGMSSMSSARGLKTRAKLGQAEQYRNIEDTRAQLGNQANSSYVNMINSLSWLATGYPKYNPAILQSGGGGGGGGGGTIGSGPDRGGILDTSDWSHGQPSAAEIEMAKINAMNRGGSGYGGGMYMPEGDVGSGTSYWDESNPNYYEDASSGSNIDYWPDPYAREASDIPYYSGNSSYEPNYYDPYSADYVDEGYYD